MFRFSVKFISFKLGEVYRVNICLFWKVENLEVENVLLELN